MIHYCFKPIYMHRIIELVFISRLSEKNAQSCINNRRIMWVSFSSICRFNVRKLIWSCMAYPKWWLSVGTTSRFFCIPPCCPESKMEKKKGKYTVKKTFHYNKKEKKRGRKRRAKYTRPPATCSAVLVRVHGCVLILPHFAHSFFSHFAWDFYNEKNRHV
uniref:Uncharacterized protein n=1 Tax=Oryza brachyantha TaxID=4533 RepID=J3M1H1_ORYBR